MQLKNLTTNFLGRNSFSYKIIDSTQDEIWRIVEKGNINNGTLVMADIQECGRGTHGRVWHTDEEKNIAFSFLIKPNCSINKIDGLTTNIAKIILNILKEEYKVELEIKKPNDIVYHNKKIGGILTETKLVSEQVKYLVVGIGINTIKMQFTDDIKDIATSIKKEFELEIDAQEFIAKFCNKFEKYILERIEK
jgi:BirA family biotin operon repressor/biotin-[acetyl-CoA-carboxylase] ligase